ncbi:MAG TPA: hypothetical protein VHB73_05505 [Alphaproteobacteria bacterium]|nr:hypothetical protein [Alphaproteobacteria bacterium]
MPQPVKMPVVIFCALLVACLWAGQAFAEQHIDRCAAITVDRDKYRCYREEAVHYQEPRFCLRIPESANDANGRMACIGKMKIFDIWTNPVIKEPIAFMDAAKNPEERLCNQAMDHFEELQTLRVLQCATTYRLVPGPDVPQLVYDRNGLLIGSCNTMPGADGKVNLPPLCKESCAPANICHNYPLNCEKLLVPDALPKDDDGQVAYYAKLAGYKASGWNNESISRACAQTNRFRQKK